jgi:hypothetical protein
MPEEQDIPKQPLNEEVSADPIMQALSISPSETQPPNGASLFIHLIVSCIGMLSDLTDRI